MRPCLDSYSRSITTFATPMVPRNVHMKTHSDMHKKNVSVCTCLPKFYNTM